MRPFNIGLDGELNESSLYYLPADHGLDLAPYELEAGDVLFNNTSSVEIVGKVALVRDSRAAGFSNHVTRLRVVDPESLRPEWLLLSLRSLWASRFFERQANRWIGQAGFARPASKKCRSRFRHRTSRTHSCASTSRPLRTASRR